jgi:hypothetical protein
MAEKETMRLDLPEILGAAAGGALAYLLMAHLPGVYAAIACAVAIALLSAASTRATHPVLWWASVGAIAGSVVGIGSLLAATLTDENVPHRTAFRYTVIGTLAVAGLAAGIFLGKETGHEHIPRPAEMLKRASGLTAVLFAILVTARFPSEGLDAVRAFSSRLSTTTTIIATSLAVPGWIGFGIGARVGQWLRAASGHRAMSRRVR